MKTKIFKINYHSIIDVITNSSTELFINGDKRLVELFKELFKDKDLGDFLKIQKFKEFYDEHYLAEFKEERPEKYEKEYGMFADDDDILVCYYSTEDLDSSFSEFLEAMNFKSFY